MHIIKEHLFGLKKQIKQQPHEEQGSVLVHDRLQVRGDIISSLPVKFGSEFFVALIIVPVKKVNTFTIAVGSLRITLKSNMTLKPNLDSLKGLQDQHDNTLSLIASDGKHIYLHFSSNEMFDRWHLALRDALAELILTESFTRIKDGSLSIRKIEMAVQKGQLLVSEENLYMQKARRLLEAKSSLKQVLSRLTKNPQSVSREEAELFLQSIGGDTLLQKDSQFQLLQSLVPKLYSQLALESLQAPITNNVSIFSLSTSASVNESITATLQHLKTSPVRPTSPPPQMHIRSPVRNRFHQTLTEVTLHSISGGGRKNKLPRQEITDFCNVLIDDAGALDTEMWGEVFASPTSTPLPNKRLHHVSTSNMKRDKRRKNRIVKFHSVKTSSGSEGSRSAQSSAEKKSMSSVEMTDATQIGAIQDDVNAAACGQEEEVWVDEVEEEVLKVVDEKEPVIEPGIVEVIEDVTVTEIEQEVVYELQSSETLIPSPELEDSVSSIVEAEIESPAAEDTATIVTSDVEELSPSVSMDVDTEIAMLLKDSVVPLTVSTPDSVITKASVVIEVAPSVLESQEAVFEQDYKELFGEEQSLATPQPSLVDNVEVTEQSVEAMEDVPVQEELNSVPAEPSLDVIPAQESAALQQKVDEIEVLETPVKSVVEESLVDPSLTTPLPCVGLSDVNAVSSEAPCIIGTPVITPAKSEMTLNAFNALKSLPSTGAAAAPVPVNAAAVAAPPVYVKRVSPELVIRVRPRGRRLQNKTFKSRGAAATNIVAPSSKVSNENTPPVSAAAPVVPAAHVTPPLAPHCSFLPSKLTDSLPLSGSRSPFREIGNTNNHSSVVNMLLHHSSGGSGGADENTSDKFRNLKGFPLLPSNSKVYQNITNSLARIDSPIQVSNSHTTTSVFTMRPADSVGNAGVFSYPLVESIGTPVVSTQPPNPQQQLSEHRSFRHQSPAEVLLSELTTKYKPNPTSSEHMSRINTSSFPEEEFEALLEALMAEPEPASTATETVEPTVEDKVVPAMTEKVVDKHVEIVSPQTVQSSQSQQPKRQAPIEMKSKVKGSPKNTTVVSNPTVSHWKNQVWIYGLFVVCLLPLFFLGAHFAKQGALLNGITWSTVSAPSAGMVHSRDRLNMDNVRRDYLKALQEYEAVGGYNAQNPLTVSEVELRIIVSSPIKMSRVLQLSKRKIRAALLNALKAVGRGVTNFFKKVVGFVTFKAIEE